MTFDVLDNVVLGEPPLSFYGGPASSTFSSGTVNPPTNNPTTGRPRRQHQGAACLGRGAQPRSRRAALRPHGRGAGASACTTTPATASTTICRPTSIASSVHHAARGPVPERVLRLRGRRRVPERHRTIARLDQSQLDDVDQFTFSVARRNTPEELQAARERGELVLNGGVQFQIRNQDSMLSTGAAAGMTTMTYRRRDLQHHQRDHVHDRRSGVSCRYRGLRLEGEFAWVTGGMDTPGPDQHARAATTSTSSATRSRPSCAWSTTSSASTSITASRAATATSKASRPMRYDRTVRADRASSPSTSNNRNVSTFRFHPSYHVDLILWRHIMRQVTGAYYFRPSISYDFVRTAFGQLAGARARLHLEPRRRRSCRPGATIPTSASRSTARSTSAARTARELTDGFQAHAPVRRAVPDARPVLSARPRHEPRHRADAAAAARRRVSERLARSRLALQLGRRWVDKRSMARADKVVYECSECGAQSPKWLGKCPGCGAWNTLVEVGRRGAPRSLATRRRRGLPAAAAVATLAEIDASDAERHPTGIEELDRALGGGIVAGGVVLIGGDPGIGKSTLLLQALDALARPMQGALRHRRGESARRWRCARAGSASARARCACSPRPSSRRSLRDARERAAAAGGDRFDPDRLQRARCTSAPGIGRAGARVRRAADPISPRRAARAIVLVGHVTKDGALAGPQRARAHRRHRALFRGRHALELSPGSRDQRTASAPSTRSASSR